MPDLDANLVIGIIAAVVLYLVKRPGKSLFSRAFLRYVLGRLFPGSNGQDKPPHPYPTHPNKGKPPGPQGKPCKGKPHIQGHNKQPDQERKRRKRRRRRRGH